MKKNGHAKLDFVALFESAALWVEAVRDMETAFNVRDQALERILAANEKRRLHESAILSRIEQAKSSRSKIILPVPQGTLVVEPNGRGTVLRIVE